MGHGGAGHGPHAVRGREREVLNILGDSDEDDPILSVVDIIDVFLVVIAVAENPLNPFARQDVLAIRNPGRPDMEMLVRQGNELKQYQSSGQIGEGQVMKAGVAYRMKDGRMVYVPETTPPADVAARPGSR